MRFLLLSMFAVLAACAPPSPQTEQPEDATAGSSGVGRIEAEAFVLAPETLVGLWSFDRSCANYDLVFAADGSVQHYVVAADGMTTSHAGTWAAGEGNRVDLTMRVLNPEGAPSGDSLIYHLDVAAPVSDDLMGDFALDGAPAAGITARRCPEEDRD